MALAKLLTSAPGQRNVLRIPLLATFVCLAVGCLGLPKTDGVSLRQPAPPAPATDFEIVDPAEAQSPDPAAAPAPRKYQTFAHHVLDIDAAEAPVPPARYAMLDDIIDDVKARVTYDPTLKDPEAQRRQAGLILDTVDDVLTDHNFLYPPGDYDVTSLRSALAPQTYDRDTLERLLRVDVNRRRKAHARAHAGEPFYIIDCDISSFIYIGVADALGFDLRLVDLPDHMFVRWELPDGSHLNWDTNDAAVVPDEEYASDYNLGKQLRGQRVYLSSMTRREAEGFAYYLRATRFELRDQEERAIADLEKARELYPQSTQARSELAWLYATVPGVDAARRKAAIDLAKSAVDLEPKVGDFWDSLAAAHAANGDFKRAVACASRAEKLADNDEARGEYRERRKAYERGQMPSFKREPEAQKVDH
jgi:tetratricopeptide (TPR) repeat protein